jgi:hypothetical protein
VKRGKLESFGRHPLVHVCALGVVHTVLAAMADGLRVADHSVEGVGDQMLAATG